MAVADYKVANVRPERTGQRDEKLTERHTQYNTWDAEFSARHRIYGRDCPMMNVDGILSGSGMWCSDTSYIEYDNFMPESFVEYKNEHWNMPKDYKSEAWAKLLVNTARPHGVPAYLAVYSNEYWWYRCYPLEKCAEAYFTEGQEFSEREYVVLMYKMRGRIAPEAVLDRLNTVRPDELRRPPMPPLDVVLSNRRAVVVSEKPVSTWKRMS